ncbi:MAG TPA: DUF4160 domain-containing protein [Opitutales bacterium]|nr:DUF4160 domain-containing protein [Opitutales bacterium]
MPKLYEYFGLKVFFYANEHLPVHVHGFKAGRESKAEIIMVNGKIIEIRFEEVSGMLPLGSRDLADFRLLVEGRAEEIVQKWADFFVFHRHVHPVRILRRLK